MGPAKNIPVEFAVDTGALGDGDVASTTIEIPNAVLHSGGAALLSSLTLLDEADQGVALDLVFLRSNVSLGTVNSAPNISDANAREIIGKVSVTTNDYIDVGGAKVASLTDINLLLSAVTGTSLFVSLISRGTPTFGAAGAVKATLGLLR